MRTVPFARAGEPMAGGGHVGARLKEIVDEVRSRSSGLVNVDLARLNLRVGKPLSRLAAELPDDEALVSRARAVADEILGKRRA